jgi:hypothetical protein
MRCPFLFPILALSLFAAPAAQAQTSRAQLPRELDGAWELVAVDGKALPLAPVRGGGDPSECGDHGVYVGQRVGEGRVVVRTAEMWKNPRSDRWVGGVYAYVPTEIICRAPGGLLIVLRRDEHNLARLAHDVAPVWHAGSYGMDGSTASVSAGDHHWRLARGSPGGAGTLTAEDEEGIAWTFRRAAPGPRFETPGFATMEGDFDGDGRVDQVSVTPGPYGSRTMMSRLAAGPVELVADVPAGAVVVLAPRGRVWRNADGTALRLTDRDAVIVSTEPAPERSDVVLYFMRNGAWTAWEYSPD